MEKNLYKSCISFWNLKNTSRFNEQTKSKISYKTSTEINISQIIIVS